MMNSIKDISSLIRKIDFQIYASFSDEKITASQLLYMINVKYFSIIAINDHYRGIFEYKIGYLNELFRYINNLKETVLLNWIDV